MSCGKIPFSTAAMAWRIIVGYANHHWLGQKLDERPIDAYRCPQCHEWHITHRKPARRPRPDESWHWQRHT